MILPNLPIPAKCPVCGSENVRTKWSLTTILACVGRILAVPTVKIFDRQPLECGEEFQVFQK